MPPFWAINLLQGAPVVPCYPFSPTRIDYRKKGTLILTSLLEDLVLHRVSFHVNLRRTLLRELDVPDWATDGG